MEFESAICWEQGLFLQPQHLQLTDLHHQYILATQLKIQNPYYWGVYACEYDRTLLENNVFSLTALTVVMPDGSLVELPKNARLIPRSFAEVFAQKIDTFKVFLGVKRLQSAEPNVTELEGAQLLECSTRFITEHNARECADVYLRGPTAAVKQLKYAVRLFWETETAQLQNYTLLPIAKISKNATGAYLNDTFIPPLLCLQASENLMRVISGFSEQLVDRVKQIESLKHGANYYEQSANQTKLLILQSLGRAVPRLLHLVNEAAVHPMAFYEVLISLLGELSVFSTDISIVGENLQNKKIVSSYQHEDLATCISGTCELIISLLNQIVLGSQYLVTAQKEDNYYLFNASEPFFSGKQHFYLLVQAPHDDLENVLQQVNSTAKLCAYSQINRHLQYALPGVGLKKLTTTPNGVPRISDCLYFQIDQTSADWQHLEREKKIAFYVGNLTVNLTVSLAGSKD